MQTMFACGLRPKNPFFEMAIYHLNVKPLSRSKGHTCGEALAYETGQTLETIEGKKADFSRKSGVEQSAIIGTDLPLQKLADSIELSEKRKNSTLGRRMTIALPAELNKSQRWEAAQDFGKWLNHEYGVAVVVSMHSPDRGGDQRNHHAHITISDRRLINGGYGFGEKARELTCMDKKKGVDGVPLAKFNLNLMREKWEYFAKVSLELAGKEANLSCKSLEAQGIDRTPGLHIGREKTEQHRKGGYFIQKVAQQQEVKAYNERITKARSKPTLEKSDRAEPIGSERNQRPVVENESRAEGITPRKPDSEEPHFIRGSQSWENERRSKRIKEKQAGAREPLRKIQGIIDEIRDQIRGITACLPKSDRGLTKPKKREVNER